MNTSFLGVLDLSTVFLRILDMSVSASWIVLAVLALRLCMRRAPKWWSVLLWGFVAIRLMLPFSIESALSLLPRAEIVSPMVASAPAQSEIVPVIGGAAAVASGEDAGARSIWTIMAWIWLAGVAALGLYTAVSTMRLRHKLREAVRLRGNIYQSEQIDSPFVLGTVRPKIYLPYHMDSCDVPHVLAHEQAHICRGDHLWKPLGLLLLTVHWFNPLMWLSYVLLCRDIELACDERVIRTLGNAQRADYMQALVSCSVNRRVIAACPLAFGEIGVKERVRSVMNYKKPTFWIILLAVAACIVLAVCFLTDPAGLPFDAARDTIVSAVCIDLRAADDPVRVEMSPAQISELSSRLSGIKGVKKSERYGGQTPMYQISARLQDGTTLLISGYSTTDETMTDIDRDGTRYAVADSDFQSYLSRICAGTDVAEAENAADTANTAPEEKNAASGDAKKADAEQPAQSDTQPEAPSTNTMLDEMISKAILDHYADAVQPGQIHVESHVVLAEDRSNAEAVTVYLLVLQEIYSADGETLTMENGSYVPTAITFSLSSSSGTPTEYWEPGDGSYSDDIRAKFPADAAEEALDDQAYIDDLKASCYQKAVDALNSMS